MTDEEYLDQLVEQRVSATLFRKCNTPEIRDLLEAGIPMALIANAYMVAAKSKARELLKEEA